MQLYKPDNMPERHREMHWVSKLTRACDEGRFELFYQPIVAIGSNSDEREHFELMLRLRDEIGALVRRRSSSPRRSATTSCRPSVGLVGGVWWRCK